MGQPNILVPVALTGFLLAVAGCFALLEPRRAVLRTMLGGWLFLPHFDDRFQFLFVHTKAAFVPAVVLLGSIAFDTGAWRRLRPQLLDLPVAVLSLEPFVTALDNDLGLKEAVAAALAAAMTWGAPYLLGRLYFGQPRALKDLATALVTAALVYVPLCLWEVRMSPQLHRAMYGFQPWSFDQALRFGGYRPSVFMQHGLAVGMFMAVGTLSAFWLWRTRAQGKLGRAPMAWVCALLAATTVLCKSTGAVILLLVGVAVLEGTRRLHISVLLVALALVPPVYCAARLSGWNAVSYVELSRDLVNAERASSVQFRVDNENLLIRRAMMRPWLGWGRYGRSLFVLSEEGERQAAIPDAMWVIALGFTGLIGLIATGLVLALPPLALLWTVPARYWASPRLAPASALAAVPLLWAIDDLLNAMMTPVYPAIAGALVSFVLIARTARTRKLRPIHGVRSEAMRETVWRT